MKKLSFNNFHSSIFYLILLVLITSCSVRKSIVVAPNLKYKTVQSAIDAVPFNNQIPVKIYIKNGVYKEVVTIDTRKNNIHLIGEDSAKTIITFNNHSGTKLNNGDTLNTWTCASVFMYGNNITCENISFENNAGFTAGQAVALRVEGNRCAFKNCRFIGNQDVLFLSASGVKQYFKNCYIEGTTDFIFGSSTALFDSCFILSKKNSHVTAASTNSIVRYGFVFKDCVLKAKDSSINKVSLGRPWQPHASVTYINCYLDKHIITDGWNNWKNPANELTARYSEYNSYGPGANASARVKWSKQLTKEEAENYSMENILGSWKPFE